MYNNNNTYQNSGGYGEIDLSDMQGVLPPAPPPRPLSRKFSSNSCKSAVIPPPLPRRNSVARLPPPPLPRRTSSTQCCLKKKDSDDSYGSTKSSLSVSSVHSIGNQDQTDLLVSIPAPRVLPQQQEKQKLVIPPRPVSRPSFRNSTNNKQPPIDTKDLKRHASEEEEKAMEKNGSSNAVAPPQLKRKTTREILAATLHSTSSASSKSAMLNMNTNCDKNERHNHESHQQQQQSVDPTRSFSSVSLASSISSSSVNSPSHTERHQISRKGSCFGSFSSVTQSTPITTTSTTTNNNNTPTCKTMGRARISYSSEEEGHLSFEEGQIIEILCMQQNNNKLWKGRAIRNGKELIGLFPSTAVALMKPRKNSNGGAESSAMRSKTVNRECISPEIEKLETECNRRFHVLIEIVETEMRHVVDLHTVLEVFIRPFEDSFGSVLTRQVFSDWVPLLRVHEQVLIKLIDALPQVQPLVDSVASIARDPKIQLAMHENKSNMNNSNKKLKGNSISMMSHRCMSMTCLPTTPEGLKQQNGSATKHEQLFTKERGEELERKLDLLEHTHKEHLAEFVFLDNTQIHLWESALTETAIKICKVMIEMSDWLKLCIPCVVNQPSAIKTLSTTKVSSSSVAPKAFIQQQETNERARLNNLDLASYLIKPMQRITKYPLLMRELSKYTASSHDDQAKLLAKEACDKMSLIASNVNEIMRQHCGMDHSKRMVEICQQLRPRETVETIGLGENSKLSRLYRYGKVTFQTINISSGNNNSSNNNNNNNNNNNGGGNNNNSNNTNSATTKSEGEQHHAQLAKTEEIKTGPCYAMLFASVLLLTMKTCNKWKTRTKYHIIKVVDVGSITKVESMGHGALAIRTVSGVLLITPLEGDVLEWILDFQEALRVVAADRERQDVAHAQMRKNHPIIPLKYDDGDDDDDDDDHDIVSRLRRKSIECTKENLLNAQANCLQELKNRLSNVA